MTSTESKDIEKLCKHHANWENIHRISLSGSRTLFEEYMEWLAKNYWCEKCRPHITKFISDISPKKLKPEFRGGIDIAPFRYTVKFHNVVNSRLGKPIRENIDELLPLYISGMVCTEDCDTPSTPPEYIEVIIPQQTEKVYSLS